MYYNQNLQNVQAIRKTHNNTKYIKSTIFITIISHSKGYKNWSSVGLPPRVGWGGGCQAAAPPNQEY
jgi:hypothetical protein